MSLARLAVGAANLELLQGLATVAGTEATIIAAPNNPDAPIHPARQGPLVVDLIIRPRFGPNELRPYRGNLIDIDGDGRPDLRLWFTTAKLGVQSGEQTWRRRRTVLKNMPDVGSIFVSRAGVP